MASPIFTILLIFASSFLKFPLAKCKYSGFTTNLILRDYPQKSASLDFNDFLSSKSNYFDWLSKSVNRSFSRAAYFNNVISQQSSSMSAPSRIIESPLTSLGGAYVMEVGIGTPPVKIVAIADTGSDVAWTQCKPCINCFKQNDPLFDSSKTSTYRRLSCQSQPCEALDKPSCEEPNKCSYELTYGDNSHSRGDLAVDTFTFQSSDGKNVSFPKTVFGCGHDNGGNFYETASGIIGLGGGALSIVNQFSSTISKKFSYCLVPIGESSKSKISFGVDALPPGSKAVSTPLLKGRSATFYFITLEGISVEKEKNNSDNNYMIDTFMSRQSPPPPLLSSRRGGNMIIDSGTTLNLLPHEIYTELRSTLIDTIGTQPIQDPSGHLDLCYETAASLEFPDLVFHFTGADVVVPQENAFLEISEGVVCLMMVPAGRDSNFGIYGNLAQMNFLVEYDIDNEKLSFLPTDCTKEG